MMKIGLIDGNIHLYQKKVGRESAVSTADGRVDSLSASIVSMGGGGGQRRRGGNPNPRENKLICFYGTSINVSYRIVYYTIEI
jgi:hypothetical protein